MDGPGEHRRSLATVVARHAARIGSRRALLTNLARAVVITTAAAALAAPLAAVWGIGHAEVEDYLGPHRATFTSNFNGEVELDLGPIGNAYLPSPAGPIGLAITVGGVNTALPGGTSLSSEATLAAYVNLYTEPREAVDAVLERLTQDAIVEAVQAEAVLLLVFAGWRLRRHLLGPWVVAQLTRRRAVALYAVLLALVAGSILAPQPPATTRISVAAARQFGDVTTDSVLLAQVLDRGLRGVNLLAGRQRAAVDRYVEASTASLSRQLARLPQPRAGESMILGYSDLHCNQATTELITRLVGVTYPAAVISAGDDTVNGTAVERSCIRREAQIFGGAPILVASGNHDSDVTEAQMRAYGMTVLDGSVVETAGWRVLGDDDPEQNVPFSVDRFPARSESEEQLGQRLVEVARARGTDVLVVHQPAASVVAMETPDPPARLVFWGHFHAEAGPTVIEHADGTWTVGMQQGTAGGVKQPTLASFSTPFSPPLVTADVYFYFRDEATGLVTGVQPVRFRPDGQVVIEPRIATGDPTRLAAIRARAAGSTPTATPSR